MAKKKKPKTPPPAPVPFTRAHSDKVKENNKERRELAKKEAKEEIP